MATYDVDLIKLIQEMRFAQSRVGRIQHEIRMHNYNNYHKIFLIRDISSKVNSTIYQLEQLRTEY